MVSGLKIGDRVTASARKALGDEHAKRRFPATWEAQVLAGIVTNKVRRSVVVRWDGIGTTTQTSTRLLKKETTVPTAEDPEDDVTEAPEATPTVSRRRRRRAPRAAARRANLVIATAPAAERQDSDDDDDDFAPIPENHGGAFDSDEEADAEDNDSPDPLCPHGLQWTVKPHGVLVDVNDRATAGSRIVWQDTLGNDRSPIQYYMHCYPHEHLPDTLEATNESLEEADLKPTNSQEYFVYLGLLYAMSFYPKFSAEELFSPTADVRRAKFIMIPVLSKYMTHRRFKEIRKHLTFSHMLTAREMTDCVFWQVECCVCFVLLSVCLLKISIQ